MSETRSISEIVETLQAAVASGELVMAPTDGQVIRQLRERVAELEAQRDRVLALCDKSEAGCTGRCDDARLPFCVCPRDLPDAVRAIYAADQPCPAGCPHPHRSHGPDGCRVRVGKCDVCACREPGSAQPANLEAQK